MTAAGADFETASECDLRVAGAWAYSRHPSTHILCLAFRIPGGKLTLWVPGDDYPEELLQHARSGGYFEAFNANFERVIWRNVCVPTYGWPEIPDDRWICLQARSLYRALPADLDSLGGVLDLAHQKDKRGKFLLNKLSKPRKPTKSNPDVWNRDPELMQELYRYCGRDVLTDEDVAKVVPPLPADEQRLYELDTIINLRGVALDIPAVEGAIAIRDEAFRVMSLELSEITAGAVSDLNDTTGLRNYLGVDSVAKEALAAQLERETLPDRIRAIELRQLGGLSSVKKLERMRACADPDDGRARFLLQYHKATTGRWASGLIQIQNLVRPPDDFEPDYDLLAQGDYGDFAAKYPDVLSAIKFSMRGFLMARRGALLNAADFSGIESRVLAWIAGEEWKLEAFRASDRGEGKDNYLHAADAIYGYECASKKTHPVERQVGKVAELALGFQGWIGAFIKMGGDRLGLDEDRMKEIILAWRKKHYRTVMFWPALEEATVEAVETGEPQEIGPFVVRLESPWMTIQLPSGRKLFYYNPRIIIQQTHRGNQPAVRFDAYKTSESGGRVWRSIDGYGGLYTENVVQAISRDLLVYAMWNAERAGWPIVMHVHDELVCEVPTFMSDPQGLEQVMREVPPWATGLPLNSSGWENERFTK